jgi:hypothetical protein
MGSVPFGHLGVMTRPAIVMMLHASMMTRALAVMAGLAGMLSSLAGMTTSVSAMVTSLASVTSSMLAVTTSLASVTSSMLAVMTMATTVMLATTRSVMLATTMTVTVTMMTTAHGAAVVTAMSATMSSHCGTLSATNGSLGSTQAAVSLAAFFATRFLQLGTKLQLSLSISGGPLSNGLLQLHLLTVRSAGPAALVADMSLHNSASMVSQATVHNAESATSTNGPNGSHQLAMVVASAARIVFAALLGLFVQSQNHGSLPATQAMFSALAALMTLPTSQNAGLGAALHVS